MRSAEASSEPKAIGTEADERMRSVPSGTGPLTTNRYPFILASRSNGSPSSAIPPNATRTTRSCASAPTRARNRDGSGVVSSATGPTSTMVRKASIGMPGAIRIIKSYSLADLMIRIAPGIPMEAFRTIVDVGPVAELTTPDPSLLRALVGAEAHERVVLVAFGGIALDGLPFDRLARMNGYRFVVSGPVPDGTERIRSSASIPMAFGSLLASADLIVTKPGYSTVVAAVAYRKPVVYVRRYNFADEAVLVDYLHRHGHAAELSAGDFTSGRWEGALRAARAGILPRPAPAPTGATEAADLVMKHLI